jgi:iron-sulfur cluster repair protein YtfE (RIC family)
MARRHDALIPLTHDHHHGLAQARRLRIAADSESEERLGPASEFIEFFEASTLQHFRDEEEVVFPVLVGAVDEPPEVLVRVLVEHLRIHHLAARLRNELSTGSVSAETMSELAGTLEAHIRTEERELFPLIERVVAPRDLAAIDVGERRQND